MLLLASASPRRADLLSAAGIPFDVFAVAIDETPWDNEAPEAHVSRLAQEKAHAAAALRPRATVLAADTVVVLDGKLLGKPKDAADATAMLRAIAGRMHEVFTGVALLAANGEAQLGVACTRVWFSSLSDAELDWYVRSGEPMDKAGAYAIQGLGSRFVERIDGSYSNVVGLPVGLVWRFLRDLPEIRQMAAI